MTSSPDPEPARQPPPQRPPEQYEPYLDGLFTYCMSVLCDHDDAVAALGDVLAIAERQPRRRPATPAEWRPWLYSLARWACVRRMDRKPAQRSAHRPGQRPAHRPTQKRPAEERRSGTAAEQAPGQVPEPMPASEPEPEPVSEAAAHRRRRELAALAWPEAAGTTPEQREALELAVRHRLPAEEVATVLGQHPDAARVLLSTAAAEVERTRAALAVVDQHGCPAIARLAGDSRLFLSAALSRELVRHVDDCADCRRAAERAGAGWAWPGTLRAARPEGPLPVLRAPRASAYTAMLRAQRTRFAHPPRFDRRGYPRDPRHRAARRGRLRSRAVTSTVVATVIAAPVLALWAANRGGPGAGEAQPGWPPPSAGADEPEELDGRPVEKAGSAHDDPSPRSSDHGGNRPDVSVEVVDRGGATPGRPGVGPGRLTVEAWPSGETTYLRLRASGGAPVDWRLGTDAPWLRFSATYGTLRPGEATTVAVVVAEASEPRGGWQARVYVTPGGAAVLISGAGSGTDSGTGSGTGTGRTAPGPARPPTPNPPKSPSPPPSPSPSGPAPSPSDPDPDPDPSPSDPGPGPSDPDPSPPEPPPSTPAPPASPASSSPPPAGVPSPAG
ncbi:sigma-70 family RNA polymerase sigma factor [Streptomyces sp. 184]|uniref:sigma-70 family RNA polymerase sigma factor n=1 Tax=Streptomyces sp. 184 TaxID=1827526 RepID=UPI003891F560